MNKDEIFQIIKAQLLAILPDCDPQQVVPAANMRELGANSVDRADVVIQSLEALRLKIPLHETAGLKNLQELVDLLHARLVARGALSGNLRP